MKWFDNLSVRYKLFFSFSFLLGLLLLISGVAVKVLFDLQHYQKELYQHHFTSALELNELRANLNIQRARVFEMITFSDPAKRSVIKENILKLRQENSIRIDKLQQLNSNDSAFIQKLEALKRVRDEYLQTQNQVFSSIEAVKINQAKSSNK